MTPVEITFGALGALGGVGSFAALVLVLRDRTKQRDQAETSRDGALTTLTTQVHELTTKLTQAHGDDTTSLIDRAGLNIRVGALENAVKESASESRETREKVIAMEASNEVAHRAVQETLRRLEGSVTGLQSQIRLAVSGGADKAVEIRRSTR